MSWYIPGEALIWRKKQPTGYPVLIRVEFDSYTPGGNPRVKLPNGELRILSEKDVRRPVYTKAVPETMLREVQYAQ